MKIDETDIRKFGAKQLTVDYTLPSTAVSVDMFEGALVPSEGETHTPLSGVTVGVLFRGKNRNEIQRYVSDFNAILQKGVVLTLDGYERYFKGYMTGNTLSKTIAKGRYTADYTFTGYWFSETVKLTWENVHEMIFEAMGNRWTPCKVTITATEYIEEMRINGFSDEIIIHTIPRGATVIIDGERGFAMIDGENKFGDIEGMMEFPFLKTGKDKSHHLIFSNKNAMVTIEYNPMWI